MRTLRLHGTALVSGLALALAGLCADTQAAVHPTSASPAASNAPDGQLYTTYQVWNAFTFFNWSVCGKVPGSYGCYASGQLTGFGRIGAMVEGASHVDSATHSVWRDLYVVDQAVAGSRTVALSVYRFNDVIVSGSLPTITCTRIKRIVLPLTGGSNAKTWLAGNAGFVFVGTDQGTNSVMVSKTSYAITTLAGTTLASKLSSITADDDGYVVTAYGGASGGHVVTSPHGTTIFNDTGPAFVLQTGKGTSTSDMDAGGTAAPVAPLLHFQRDAPRVETASLPDYGLFRSYTLDASKATVNYSLCGTLAGSRGCYASGTIGTFGHVGAMVEGPPTSNPTNHTVTRKLYVVDQAVGGGASTTMRLRVYKLFETVTAPTATVTVTPAGAVNLPITGGANAKTYLAANDSYLFVMSSADPADVSVSVADLTASSYIPFSPPINGSLLSANAYGFVALTFGGTQNGNNGFFVVDAYGRLVEDGGGPDFMLGTTQGLSLTDGNLGIGNPAALAPRMQVHFDTASRESRLPLPTRVITR